MSKHEKTLAKLCRKPPPSDMKWDELVSLLGSMGFVLYVGGKSGGSRRRFVHRDTKQIIMLHEPHPKPDIDKGAIAQTVGYLIEYGFIKES